MVTSNVSKFNIGSLQLDVPFFQAPLAGYTDWVMRLIAREYNCPLTFSGVIPAKALLRSKVIKRPSMAIERDIHPVGAQLLDRDPDEMVQGAKILEATGYDIIDLNFACPVRKVLRRKTGGHMMQEPDLVREIFRRIRDAVKCPVTMKIRIGYNNLPENREKFWQIVENAAQDEADMICIHGRTVAQLYGGKADWSLIEEAKQRFPKLTIVGSGDLMTAERVVEVIKTGLADGALLARGAVGNPWIFNEIRALLKNEPLPEPPSLQEQGELVLRHFELMQEAYGLTKVSLFNKFIVRYTHHHPTPKKVKLSLMYAEDLDQFRSLVREWYGLA